LEGRASNIISICLVSFQAKEVYHARCFEYEKLKRENAQPKELEKAEAKFRKASKYEYVCSFWYVPFTPWAFI
jgi:hypothetical protein